MIIYNVTVCINQTAHKRWLSWMRETHMPEMLATGKFVQARMCKVLVAEEDGDTTYAIQYLSPSREKLQQYYEEDASRLRNETMKYFSDTLVTFRTEMEVVDEQSTSL